MANLNITNSIDHILHYSRPRRKTVSAVDMNPINLNSKSDAIPSKPSTQVLQGLSRKRRSSSSSSVAPAAPQDPSWTTTKTTAATKASTSSLFATLTTPAMPPLPSSFFPLRSRASKQRLRFSSPDMAVDPRDPGALEPPPASNSASTSSPSAKGSAYLRPRFSHHYPSFFTSPAPELSSKQVDSPQTRFSFEYHLPLHEEALTASATTTAARQQSKSHQRRHSQHAQKNSVTAVVNNSASDSSDSSLSPDRRLHERRSVPNFSLPKVASRSSPAVSSPKQPPKQQQQQQQQQQNSSSTPLAPLDQNNLRPREGDSTPGSTTNNALSTNAAKRKRRSTIIAQQASRPFAKDAMPLSTMTYSPARSTFVGDSKSRAVGNGAENNNPNGTSRNEDLFLNIAQSDPSRRDSLTRSESRRSRFGFNGASLRSPTSRVNSSRNTPSPEQLRTNNPLRARHTSYGSVAHSSSASAHPLEDPGRSRYSTAIGSSSRSTIGLPRSRLSRTSPDASPKSPSTNVDRRSSLHEPRAFGTSTLSTIRSSRQPSVEAAEKPPEKARQDGSESTLSTNAPSTVWDELEDLKSRIRNLELTGKPPPSSQAAMSSAERPRTAATTITTFSSPPKHKRKSNMAIPDADAAQVHPLLQSALATAKSALSYEVYRTLEATVNDAVSLSALLGSGSVPSGSVSVANGYSSPDKQSKRKADSVCRGLTELCIALSDAHFNQQQQSSSDQDENAKTTPQDGNMDKEPSTPVLSFQRSPSFEPEGMIRRRSTNRVISRLESRRTSLVNGTSPGTNNDNASPSAPDTKQTTPKEQPQSQPQPSEQSPQQPQTPSQPQTNTASAAKRRPSRLSTSMRAPAFPMEEKPVEEEPAEKGASHSRTLSRALTDVATPSSNGLNTRHRLSSGYIPYRPSAPNSPQEQSFTPQTPQTPSSQQAPPPLPQQQEQQSQRSSLPRTPSLPGIPLRRSFMAPVNYTPGSSRSGIQAGSRRYGLQTGTPSLANGVAETTDSPQQAPPPPLPSQTRIIPSSTKMASASSYTPIQQNRTRTGSLGTRRFGIRPRPMVNHENVVHL